MSAQTSCAGLLAQAQSSAEREQHHASFRPCRISTRNQLSIPRLINQGEEYTTISGAITSDPNTITVRTVSREPGNGREIAIRCHLARQQHHQRHHAAMLTSRSRAEHARIAPILDASPSSAVRRRRGAGRDVRMRTPWRLRREIHVYQSLVRCQSSVRHHAAAHRHLPRRMPARTATSTAVTCSWDAPVSADLHATELVESCSSVEAFLADIFLVAQQIAVADAW